MSGIFSTEPFWILEYQTVDSLGRGKEWLFAGIARNSDEIGERKREVCAKVKGKPFNIRQHQYSHGFGKMLDKA